MEMLRTEQIFIPYNESISKLCHSSKNLWNEGNYSVRQEFFKTGKWIRYRALARDFKTSENFKAMNSWSAQQTLILLDKSWKSFFKSIKDWKKHPEKYTGRPKLPGYKKKYGEFVLTFVNRQVRIKKGFLHFPKNLKLIPIKTRLGDDTNLREVRIVPRGTGYSIEIVYKKETTPLQLDKSRIIGIDFGISNIATIGNNIGKKPIVVKGGVLKSWNQFYNKKRAELSSIYAKQGIKTGSSLSRLTEKRNRKMKDSMHKISRFVIDYCVTNNVGTIVIGHNKEWKQSVNMGRRNNQNFVSIPHSTLLQMIRYKSEELGIDVVEQEESHTSKCSFLDEEPVEHHELYVGKRFSRGLFRSAKGIVIHADVQGSYNIIKKAFPEAFANGIEGVGLHPERADIKKILGLSKA